MSAYNHYYIMSRNKVTGLKLTHEKMIDTLLKYYPQATYETKIDYPRGFECTMTTPESIIHFELNKYDKDNCSRILGQYRAKNSNYSKNGYIVSISQMGEKAKQFIHELNGIHIATGFPFCSEV